MGAIRDKLRAAFRDFVTDGVPASGANEPNKAEIRLGADYMDAAVTALATVIATGKAYANKAAMDADLVPGAGTLAAVYNDSTDELNGFYVKVGGTGTGSWATTNIGFPASFASDLTAITAELANKQDTDRVTAAAGVALATNGVPIEETIADGYSQMWTDLVAHWWDPTNHRIWGGDGGYTVTNTRPFQWCMSNIHTSFYWKAKAGDSDAITKVGQNFTELLARQGSTLLGQATLANDIGGSDDLSWFLQYLCQVHDITANSTALTIASNLLASGISTHADPASMGAGLLYVDDAYSVTFGHHRISATNDVFTAISALYIDEKLGTTTRRSFATHTYDWVKAYAMHPLGVLYCEVDVDPTHSGTPKAIDTVPPSPIKPHFSYTTISFSFAFMTLCKKLHDINPLTQYITDINNMMAAILQSDTFLRPGNVLCPDRDGWGNGLGFPQFVAEVLPMTGIDATLVARMKQAIVNTGALVFKNRTTPYYYNRGVHYGAGFYGADWIGPEMGTNGLLTWFQTGNNDPSSPIALPEQIATNGSTCCLATAAAMIVGVNPASQLMTRGDLAAELQQFAQSYVPMLGGVTIRDDVTFQNNLFAKYLHADALAYYTIVSSKVVLAFDNNDQFDYDRTTNRGRYVIGGVEAFAFTVTDAVFPGNLTAAYMKADANAYMTVASGAAIVNFDTNDFIDFTRSTNRGRFVIGSVEALALTATDAVFSGNLTAPYVKVDSNGYLSLVSGAVVFNFDTSDFFDFTRSTNRGRFVIGGTEAFAFTATDAVFPGNLTAAAVKADSNAYLAVSGSTVLLNFDTSDSLSFNRSSNQADFIIGGTTYGRVNSSGIYSFSGLSCSSGLSVSGGISMSGSLISSGGCQFNGATIGGVCQPSGDNSVPLGAGGQRWSVVYAGTGTINTSDEREKTWRGALSPAELAAAKEIAATIGIFQFNAAIAEKGADEARLHAGVKAQAAGAIMEAHGLDPTRYGWFCYDQWEADPGRPATEAIEGQPEIRDDEGDIIQEGIAAVPADPGLPARAAGNRYGIRYDELAMFLMAAQEQRLALLESA